MIGRVGGYKDGKGGGGVPTDVCVATVKHFMYALVPLL